MRKFYVNLIFLLTLFGMVQKGQAQVHEWAEVFGDQDYSFQASHPMAEVASKVLADKDGNVYVYGSYRLPITYRGDTAFNEYGEKQVAAVLSKMNASGDLLWSRIVYSTGTSVNWTKPASLAFDSDSNLIVSVRIRGQFHFNGTDYYGLFYSTSSSLLVYKVTPQNSLVWHKIIRGGGTNSGHMYSGGLATGVDGSIHLAVRHKSNTYFNNQTLVNGSSVRGNYSVIKLDSAGNLLWKTPFFSRVDMDYYTDWDNYFGKDALTIDEYGNTYLAAVLDSGVLDTGFILPSHVFSTFNNHHSQVTLIKFNPNGDAIWHKVIGPDNLGSTAIRPELKYIDGKLYLSAYGAFTNLRVNDSIILDTASGSYMLMLDTAGNYLDHLSIQNQTLVISEFQAMDSLLYITGTVLPPNVFAGQGNTLKINSSSSQINYSENLARGICFTLDMNSMKLRKKAIIYPTLQNVSFPYRTRDLSVMPNHDFYISGVTANSITVNNDTIVNPTLSSDYSDAFLVKFKNCDYLNAHIAGVLDTTFICQGGSTELTGGSSETGVSYQWYYGSAALTGETDSTLEANIVGTYRIRVADSICYMDSDPVFVESASPEEVDFDLPSTNFCTDDSVIILNQGTPAGGVYAGNAVSGSTFDPAGAGVGLHELQYIYDQGTGCIDTVSEYVTVGSAEAVFFASFSTACVGDSIVLNTGYPAGGTYEGPGVIGNLFAPGPGDTGNVELVYTYVNGACEDADTIQVYVAPTPNPSLNLGTTTTCEVVNFVVLNGQSPTGGTFSGTAVTGNFFIPTIAGPGEFAIAYSVTDGGCTGTALDTITVDSFPEVVLPLLDSICVGAPVFALGHGYPLGGVYSGTGISSNNFDASAAGLGSTAVMYVYENSCAADTAYSSIQVIGNPTLSALVSNVTCNGGDDGSVSVSLAGGNAPYGFLWNNGDTTSSSSALLAGSYTVTATGEGGCSATASYLVSEPAPLSINPDSLDDVVCNGFMDGAAYISVTGGTAPYIYNWSNGAVSEDVTALGAGNFAVSVTDANGCQDSLEITIDEVTPVVISSSAADISCHGASDGSITASVSGGGGIYSYAWSNGATSGTLSGLDSGSYVVNVTDQNGCSAMDTSLIAEPTALSVVLMPVNPLCHGYADGSISALGTGGTGSYAYAWSTAATTDSIGALAAGTYTLSITDANACADTASVTLTNPDSITVIISETQSISCNGGTGSLEANASNGVGAYNYSWSNAATTAVAGGITAGAYTITVSDANACFITATYNLTEPAALLLSIDSILEPLCDNDSNGYLAASATGGTGSISYAWSTGATSASISALDSGNYTITVADANGCQDSTTVLLIDGDSIYAIFTSTPVTCNAAGDGAIATTVYNAIGTPAFEWSNGDTTANLDSINGGSYILTITDGNGCTAVEYVAVSEPYPLSVNNLVLQGLECHNDSNAGISLMGFGGGGGPYSYLWNTGDTVAAISTLPADTYNLTVTSANGCTYNTSFVIDNPAPIGISVDTLSALLCHGDTNGYGMVSGTGGNGLFTWLWSDGSTSDVRTNLSAATYTLTLTDGNSGNCTVDTTFVISQPGQINVVTDSLVNLLCNGDANGVLGVSTSGGTTPYVYNWSNGGNQAMLSGLQSGNYSLTLTDANGCTELYSNQLQEPSALLLSQAVMPTPCSNEALGSITVQVSGGVTPYQYAWSNGSITASLTNLESGMYHLTVSDDNGCDLIDSMFVNYTNEAPVAELGNDTGYCAGDSLSLLQSDSGSVLWSTGATSSFIVVSTPGTYSISISANGCADSDTVEIEEYPLPLIELGSDTMMCIRDLEEGLILQGPPGLAQYFWSTGGVDSVEMVTAYGSYWLTGTSAFGCEATDTIDIMSDTCVGIADVKSTQWLIYPNPTREDVTITGDTEHGNVEVTMYDALGQVVLRQSFQSSLMTLSLKHLSAGVYHVKLSSEGAVLYYGRVVVE